MGGGQHCLQVDGDRSREENILISKTRALSITVVKKQKDLFIVMIAKKLKGPIQEQENDVMYWIPTEQYINEG